MPLSTFLKSGGPILIVISILGIIGTSYAVEAYNEVDKADEKKTTTALTANASLLAIYCVALILGCVLTGYTYSKSGRVATSAMETASPLGGRQVQRRWRYER